LQRGNSPVVETLELGTNPGSVRRSFDGALLDVSPALAHRLWPSEIALRGPLVFPSGFASVAPTSLVVRCDGVRETLTHDPAGWTMQEPHGFKADSVAASDLAQLVENAQADSWIADADDGTFGFAKSPCQVDVEFAGEAGKRRAGLVFGKESGDGEFYAHASGEAPVFLAPRLLREGPRALLVDKSGFRADPANVARITLTRGAARRSFVGPGGHDAGGHDPASLVRGVLETLRPDLVIHLGPPTAEEGFTTPALDVRVELDGDAGRRELHFVLGDTRMVGRQRLTLARTDGVDATFGIAHDRLEPLVGAL
jgi:hypothetical protein